MITLTRGATTLVTKNPKVGIAETYNGKSIIHTSRRGFSTVGVVGPVITKWKMEFQSLTESEKDAIVAFLMDSQGVSITVDMPADVSCGKAAFMGAMLLEDQTLDVVTVKDTCAYDILVFMLSVV